MDIKFLLGAALGASVTATRNNFLIEVELSAACMNTYPSCNDFSRG
jgi:hypothetical protein